jgi:hypothetical protein
MDGIDKRIEIEQSARTNTAKKEPRKTQFTTASLSPRKLSRGEGSLTSPNFEPSFKVDTASHQLSQGGQPKAKMTEPPAALQVASAHGPPGQMRNRRRPGCTSLHPTQNVSSRRESNHRHRWNGARDRRIQLHYEVGW